MKFKFNGVPGEAYDEINMYGTTFPLGKWVDLDEDDKKNRNALHKLPRHPFFEASDPAKALKLAAALGDPLKEYQRAAEEERDAAVEEAKAKAEADRAQEAKEVAAQEALIAKLAKEETDGNDSGARTKGASKADHSPARRGRKPRGS